MRWMVLVVAIGGLTMVGCLEDLAECEVEEDRIVCDDGTSTSIDGEEVPDDVECVSDGEEIRCDSGDRFEVGKEDGSAAAEEEGAEEDSPPWTSGNQESSGGSEGVWESCVSMEAQIDCANGESVTDSEITGEEDDCAWHRRPGVGPQVRCDDGSEWRPDGHDEEVECEWIEDEYVSCSDGTSLKFEDAEGPEECEPVFIGGDQGYDVQCGDVMVEVDDVDESWCGYPSGEFVLDDETAEEALECEFVFGDLIVRGEQPVEVFALERIEVVTGSVNIVETEQLEWIAPGAFWLVEQRVRVIDNANLIGTAWLWGLEVVEESIEITGNDALEKVVLEWLWSAQSLTVSNNPELVDLYVPADVELEGAFVLTDNAAFPMCRGQEWLDWGTEIAGEGAYVGGLASWDESGWAC